jgi:UDP-glucose-4-epimerase GalE
MSGLSLDRMKTGTWVITGGAGYLGRALALKLRAEKIRVVSLDNFSTSHRNNDSDLIEVDLTDAPLLAQIWKQIPGPIAGVFHFAAKALVGESNAKPAEYFRNNFLAALNTVDLCGADGSRPVFIHSSSCAVYGIPDQLPLTESHRLHPVSPYGASKKIVEEMLAQMAITKKVRVLNLRYFNPVGALSDLDHAEAHEPETHLIPNAIMAALHGTALPVFGGDYGTPDGTCLRDYFHLEDLMEAHQVAAMHLLQQPESYTEYFNIGAGQSTSVLAAIRLVEKAVGKPIRTEVKTRRPGDPPHLEASIAKAARILGWKPSRTLESAIQSQVRWMQQTHA